MSAKMGLKDYEQAIDGIVSIAITLAVGIMVVSQLQAVGVLPEAGNTALQELLDTLGQIPAWVGILIIVVLAYAVKRLASKGSDGNY